MLESSPPVVLVVDDTETNIDILVDILSDLYEVSVALDGESALESVISDQPDIILLDVMMPGIDGHEVCQRLKNNPETTHIPIIFVTAKTETEDESKGFALGAVDYITKPISPSVVLARVKTHLQLKQAQESLKDQNRVLEQAVAQRTQELEETRLEIILKLGRAAEFKDTETGLHVIRMSHYSSILGQAAGMKEHQAKLLLNAAPMHDIGKIGIPDAVILKPGKLTSEEFAIIQTHPTIGADIIGQQNSELLQMAHSVALNHHEKWNGKGYPNGLKGEEIPLVGRIVAIADVFDALTSVRPYKTAWSTERAFNLIKEDSGNHFDPKLASIFLQCQTDILKIKNQFEEE